MKRIQTNSPQLVIRHLVNKLTIRTKKLLFPVLFHKPLPQFNVYHCCIQKTATQWFRKLLNDKLVWKNTGLSLYLPGQNFITDDSAILAELKNIPKPGVICSPLYIRYKTFSDFTGKEQYKAFYILRDPRDIIISNYFSTRYSHSAARDFMQKSRKELELLSEHDGISKLIMTTARFIAGTMLEWKIADNLNLKVYTFEDVFGPDQFTFLRDIFAHCQLAVPDQDIQYLVDQYAFSKISGRKPGTEDQKHHYRKGVSGDWKNYFSEEHKKIFKEEAGDLLIGLGYESGLTW